MNGMWPDTVIDLVDGLLQMNPANRLTVKQALAHPFFMQSPEPCPKSQLLAERKGQNSHEYAMRKKKKLASMRFDEVPQQVAHTFMHNKGDAFDEEKVVDK